MGVTRSGRFAALTNYAAIRGEGAKSRGTLVADFLSKGTGTFDFLARIRGADYAGFNLVLFDGESLASFTNDGSEARALDPGAYAISNASTDADWPKMRDSRELLQRAVKSGIRPDELFREMRDARVASDADLPQGDAPLELRRRASSRFVLGEDYGTRCTTLIVIDQTQIEFEERSFGPMAQALGTQKFTMAL